MTADVIRERGPMTVAAFMDLALYDPVLRLLRPRAQRSGRAGDFFTSVDVGAALRRAARSPESPRWPASSAARRGPRPPHSTWSRPGAGNGRLSADILRAARRSPSDALRPHPTAPRRSECRRPRAPSARHARRDRGSPASSSSRPSRPRSTACCSRTSCSTRCRCIRSSCARRACARSTSSRCTPVDRLATSRARSRRPRSRTIFDALGRHARTGWRVEINLRRSSGSAMPRVALRRGFVILIDYGHEARELYSVGAFERHADDIRAAHRGGSGIAGRSSAAVAARSRRAGHHGARGLHERARGRRSRGAGRRSASSIRPTSCWARASQNLENPEDPENLENLKQRLALKTLLMPGGLGSTMKVLLFGKGVGPARASRLLLRDAGHVNRSSGQQGSVIMIVSEAATLAGIEPFASWNTPIAWTGFILFADGIVWQARGRLVDSIVAARVRLPRAVSIPLWLVFEFFNLYLDNWHYIGLPENSRAAYVRLRVVVRDDLAGDFRGRRSGRSRSGRAAAGKSRPGPRRPSCPACRLLPFEPRPPCRSLVGAAMLASPFLASPAMSRGISPRRCGSGSSSCSIRSTGAGPRIACGRLSSREYDRLKNLVLSGFLCGVPVGVLELLGASEVALHRADHGEPEDLRDAACPAISASRRSRSSASRCTSSFARWPARARVRSWPS